MEFKVLGPVGVWIGHEELRIGGPKPRTVLAALILAAGQVVHQDQLVDDLWGEDPPPQARTALQVYVSQLRRSLRDTPSTAELLTEGGGYALTLGSDRLDLERFEELAALGRRASAEGRAAEAARLLGDALRVWRGAALGNVVSQRLVHGVAMRMEEARLAVVEERMAAELAAGQDAAIVPDLFGLVREHPLRERFVGQLMVALYRSGRKAEALNAYRAARSRLIDEHGLDPGDDLARLEHAVLTDDASLHPPQPAVALTRARVEGNIRPVGTTFVGRADELLQLERRLAENRLVTLVGPPGCGKTRLALEVAARDRGTYPDGRWLVQLDSTAEAALIPGAIAAALGITLGTQDALDGVLAAVADKQMLIVLDNCEHLARACADVADALVETTSGVIVLATSRERLDGAGEAVHLVSPLPVPDPAVPDGLGPNVVRLREAGSVQLFLDRARLADPGFELTPAIAPAVAAICRAVEGLPLAIELAAARLHLFTPGQIADRLDRQLKLLAGKQAGSSRHRTMRAALQWSHDLLTAEQQRVFLCVSVFAGGFSLTAAEAVASDARTDVADVLADLEQRSLLEAVRHGETMRYRLAEPLRQFAAELLDTQPDADRIRLRHAEHFRDLAIEAESRRRSSSRAVWRERLDADRDNINAALRWSIDAAAIEAAVPLAAALWWWWMKAPLEGARWLREILGIATGAPADRQRLLFSASHVTSFVAPAEAEMYCSASTQLARDLGDQQALVRCLHLAGVIALWRGDLHGAIGLLEQATNIVRATGDRYLRGRVSLALALSYLRNEQFGEAWDGAETALAAFRDLEDETGVGESMQALGAIALGRGQLALATELLEGSLRSFGGDGVRADAADALLDLARVAELEDRHSDAHDLRMRGLRIQADMGDLSSLALQLERIGLWAGPTEAFRTTVLLSAAASMRRRVGVVLPKIEQDRHDKAMIRGRMRLGQEKFEIARLRGGTLPTEAIIATALDTSRGPAYGDAVS